MENVKGCVVHNMNEGYRVWRGVKSVLSNRGLGIKANKCLIDGVGLAGFKSRSKAFLLA